MGSKAMYGALMGLGEGISGYGKSLTLDELRKQEDERTFDRQHSLQEIRQRYENSVREETRGYNEKRELEKVTPGTPIYDASEAERSRLSEEKQTQSLEQIEARGTHLYGGSSGMMNKFNPSVYTEESAREYMIEVRRLMETENMTAQEAQQIAFTTVDLQYKPPSTSQDNAGMNSSIDDELAVFLDKPDELKIETLISLGEDPQALIGKSTMELIELYKTKLYGIFQRRGQDRTDQFNGLMNPGGAAGQGANPDPLNLRGGNQ